jgi:hypothetical protein
LDPLLGLFPPTSFTLLPPATRPLLGVHLLDPTADPLTFAFQRDKANTHPVQILITRHAWQLLGPSQAVDYVVDRYLLEHPPEVERVGRGLVSFCVRYALGLAGVAQE